MAALEGVKKGGTIKDKLSLCEAQGKLMFGRYCDAEMLAKLKKLALNPCDSNVSRQDIRPLCNQMQKVRVAMTLVDKHCSWKKRKLQQFAKNQLKSAPQLPEEKSNQKSESKRSRGNFSHALSSKGCHQKVIPSSSSTSSLVTFHDTLLSSKFSLQSVAVDFDGTSKDSSSIFDSDESVNGSDRSRPLQPARQSFRLLNFIGDHLRRFVIPVGPRFQADVPDWTGPDKANTEDSRWLGTRVWPIVIGNMKVNSRGIGRGRPHSCSCQSPGTAGCVKRHISDGRLILQCELGPAFFNWNFDEMGEQVSKRWTSKEEATFESLVKRIPQSNGMNFVKLALKSLPHKTRETIISYYLNVFVPRKLSLQNMSPKNLVNIGDDFADDINDIYLHKGKQGSRPNESKSRYLRRPV